MLKILYLLVKYRYYFAAKSSRHCWNSIILAWKTNLFKGEDLLAASDFIDSLCLYAILLSKSLQRFSNLSEDYDILNQHLATLSERYLINPFSTASILLFIFSLLSMQWSIIILTVFSRSLILLLRHSNPALGLRNLATILLGESLILFLLEVLLGLPEEGRQG